MRTILAVLGAVALLWGGYLAVELAIASGKDGVQVAAYVVGGPVVHDLVVAPVVGGVGLLIARRVSGRWQGLVAAGAVSTGVLVVLALPLLWRPFGVPVNPGLHDRDYWWGLGVGVAVVWGVVVVAGLVGTTEARGRWAAGFGRSGSGADEPE